MNKQIELVSAEKLDQGFAKHMPAIMPTPNPSLPHLKRDRTETITCEDRQFQ